MPIYYNHRLEEVHLVGPDGKTTVIGGNKEAELPEYFDKYVSVGIISKRPHASGIQQRDVRMQRMQMVQNAAKAVVRQSSQVASPALELRQHHRRQPPIPTPAPRTNVVQRSVKVVGRKINEDASLLLLKNLGDGGYPISNGVGVGILSYNRVNSLKRLINSIRDNTDLCRTTVFVSDDASTDPDTVDYLAELASDRKFVVLRNSKRLGVAGNSNRLLRCLARFDSFLLLNDDVEILMHGWDTFYRDAARRSGAHHFVFNQPGVYGSQPGVRDEIGGMVTSAVYERPHGAILFGTRQLVDEIGYFDESYGIYGFEHVDWSTKAYERGLQPRGFHDLLLSNRYFKTYAEISAVEDRTGHYRSARPKFESRTGARCEPSADSEVPAITYVVPFRDCGRTAAVATVLNNLRAQRFPVIDLVLVEQDDHTKVDLTAIGSATYMLVSGEAQFNKSLAFNRGVAVVNTDAVVLHDADTLAPGWYTSRVYDATRDFDGCHLGGKVIYADSHSSADISHSGGVSAHTTFDRVVGYYEGGSLACKTSTYWAVGGFNEDFRGYGCEDCDFFYRLQHGSRLLDDRYVDLLHLWHGRSPGWESAHDANKELERNLRAMPVASYITTQRAKVAHYEQSRP